MARATQLGVYLLFKNFFLVNFFITRCDSAIKTSNSGVEKCLSSSKTLKRNSLLKQIDNIIVNDNKQKYIIVHQSIH